MINSKIDRDQLTIYLSGEIDHHTASMIRADMEMLFKNQAIRRIMLDFSKVTFMDSSGIGMLIGRYKAMKARNGSMMATGMSELVERVYRLGGLHRIIPIDECGGKHEQ